MKCAAEGEREAIVNETFLRKSLGDTGFMQHFDRALLQDAGTNPRQHIFQATLLQDDIVDAGPRQKLPE